MARYDILYFVVLLYCVVQPPVWRIDKICILKHRYNEMNWMNFPWYLEQYEMRWYCFGMLICLNMQASSLDRADVQL